MIILDTNVLSALMRQTPEPRIVTWLDRQPRTSVWITAVTLLEIRFGLQIIAAGKRRDALMQSFDRLLDKIDNRIAGFDDAAAQQASELLAARHRRGLPGGLRDTMIAGIVLARHATLVTRNTAHFAGVSPIIDPWSA